MNGSVFRLMLRRWLQQRAFAEVQDALAVDPDGEIALRKNKSRQGICLKAGVRSISVCTETSDALPFERGCFVLVLTYIHTEYILVHDAHDSHCTVGRIHRNARVSLACGMQAVCTCFISWRFAEPVIPLMSVRHLGKDFEFSRSVNSHLRSRFLGKLAMGTGGS